MLSHSSGRIQLKVGEQWLTCVSMCSCKLYCHKLNKRELVKARCFLIFLYTQRNIMLLVTVTCLLRIAQLNLFLQAKKVSFRQRRLKLILATAKIIGINRHILCVESLVSTSHKWTLAVSQPGIKCYYCASPPFWFSDLFLIMNFNCFHSKAGYPQLQYHMCQHISNVSSLSAT